MQVLDLYQKNASDGSSQLRLLVNKRLPRGIHTQDFNMIGLALCAYLFKPAYFVQNSLP